MAKSLVFLALPSLIVASVVFILMNAHIPTHVRLDLIVNRAVFTLAGEEPTPILNQGAFHSITVDHFAEVHFVPEQLKAADPDHYLFEEDRYPDFAWENLDFTTPLVITPEDETMPSALSFESDSDIAGTLDKLWAKPGSEITLETTGPQTSGIILKVEGHASSMVLSFRKAFQIITDNARISGIINERYQQGALTYIARLPAANTHVEIEGLPRSLVLNLGLSSDKMTPVFSRGGIEIRAIAFTRQNERGEHESALVKGGEITYPDYPKIKKKSFEKTDFIGLENLEKFYIEEISVSPGDQGIKFRLNGFVEQIKTGTSAYRNDHRLTRFTVLWNNPKLVVLFGIVVWVFPTTLGAYKLYKEVQSGSRT